MILCLINLRLYFFNLLDLKVLYIYVGLYTMIIKNNLLRVEYTTIQY